MKNLRGFLVVVFLLCLAVGCRPPAGDATVYAGDPDADIAAIEAWYDRKTETTNLGDFEGLRALFTDDVVFMPPGGALFQGWEEYQKWARPFFEANDVEENITYEEVGVSGDWAFIRTSYRMTSTPKAGGESIPGSGKAIWLFKRQPDGSWKGSHCIWNTNE